MFNYKMKRKGESSTLAQLERLSMPNDMKQFVYEKNMPYILLVQEKIQLDPYLLDYGSPDHTQVTINCLILDKDLTLVSRSNQLRDLDKELAQTDDGSTEIPFLSYTSGQIEPPKLTLPPILYRKFPQLTDFHFGRTGFGREHQSYKIQSDSISKDHCNIELFQNDSLKQKSYFDTLKRALSLRTSVSSTCRKVTNQIWQAIFRYASRKERYVVNDLGSRNGTWLSEYGEHTINLKEKVQYQFEGENYTIHISKIFTSLDTKGESNLEHNVRVSKHIEELKKEVNWCYYEPAKKMIILGPGEDVNKIAQKDSEKIDVIVLKIRYRDVHEFYLLGITESSRKRIKIGPKQEIDVSQDQQEFPSLHGQIVLEKGKWYIEGVKNSQGQPIRKIWKKLRKQNPYCLNTKHNYNIRLGCTATFDLKFCNF